MTAPAPGRARECTHVACRGVTATGARIIPPVDSERCQADVLYGDEQCALTRRTRENYCDHHTKGECQ